MTLLTIIRKQRRKEREIRILILGLDNAGKTSIVQRLKGNEVNFDQIQPTLGFNIETILHGSYSINIWDVGGQKSLRPYWKNYFESNDAIIWVVDSTDHDRLIDTCQELNQLLIEERLAGATLLIFANKQDLNGAIQPEIIEQTLDLKSKSTSHQYRIMACSAISGSNVTEGLNWLVDQVASRLYLLGS